jgi:hypothetical protein
MTMMEQQCLATLQTLMSGGGATTLEQSLLKHFYKHCARQPAVRHRQLASVSLKTLLYRYSNLRPEMQAALNKFVADQWQIYPAAPPAPQVAPDTSQIDAAPTVHDTAPTSVLLSTPDRPPSPPIHEDWFDRFLSGVRVLLFL